MKLKDNYGYTLIYYMFKCQEKHVMELIRYIKPTINIMLIEDKYNYTPFHYMFTYQNQHIMELIKYFNPTIDDMRFKQSDLLLIFFLKKMDLEYKDKKYICDIIEIKYKLIAKEIVINE